MNEDARISIIAAIGAGNRALGFHNDLLWHIPADMRRFRDLTSGHVVIMGRKTWESIPEKFRPLPNRQNIVVTRQTDYEAKGALVASSIEDALQIAHKESSSEDKPEIFIIGGGELYTQALSFTDKLYLTLIHEEKEGNVFFPEYEQEFTKKVFEENSEDKGVKFTWIYLERA